MPLTDMQCSKAKALDKDYTKPDGNGLYLLVRAKGTKSWQCDFVRTGKRYKYNYGQYPAISLDGARRLHTVVRELAELGRNPAEVLDNESAALLIINGRDLFAADAVIALQAAEQAKQKRPTFAFAADRYKTEWVDHKWKSPDKGWSPVRVHLLPALGDVALGDITKQQLKELFFSIREKSGVQAALHSRGWCSRILDYAVDNDWCSVNYAASTKARVIGEKGKRKRYLQVQEIRRYLASLYRVNTYRGYKLALHLLLMLGLRKNEVCGAHWNEIDLDTGEWLIPANRMKSSKEHWVFLPTQAIEILRELKRLGGGSDWVFPKSRGQGSIDGRNIDTTHRAAIADSGIEDYLPHDHRHTVSTHLRNQGHNPEIVETVLSHSIGGMAGLYSHADYKELRLAMLQSWADFLDTTMNENVVLSATFRKVA